MTITCPRCKLNKFKQGRGALSRIDNLTEICSPCGTDEALIEMKKFLNQKEKKINKF